MEEIVNRVASSPLISLNLEDYYPQGERVLYDLKDNLFQGMILREKDFREFVKNHDWSQYEGKYVAITCTADAIVPTWAYMLLASKIEPIAKNVVFGDLKSLEEQLMKGAIEEINPEEFRGAKVVVKGCGDLPIGEFAYVELTKKLRPVVSSLMFGEPCSTVPIYKKPRK
jgi:hypothetical protein